MCTCVLGSRYFLARPKSITLTWLARLPRPIRKLSGLMSRWMKERLFVLRVGCVV